MLFWEDLGDFYELIGVLAEVDFYEVLVFGGGFEAVHMRFDCFGWGVTLEIEKQEVAMQRSCGVFEITLPFPEMMGPYYVVAFEEDEEQFVFFGLDISDEEAEEPTWVPIPLPKPLMQDKDMLVELAKDLYARGFQLITREGITQH